jgi:hypothetical protein
MKACEVNVAGAGYNIDEMTASPQPPFHVTAAAACVHVLLTLLRIACLIKSCTRSMQAFYLTLNLTQFAYALCNVLQASRVQPAGYLP